MKRFSLSSFTKSKKKSGKKKRNSLEGTDGVPVAANDAMTQKNVTSPTPGRRSAGADATVSVAGLPYDNASTFGDSNNSNIGISGGKIDLAKTLVDVNNNQVNPGRFQSGKRNQNISEGTDGIVAANDATDQLNGALPGRRSAGVNAAASSSSLPHGNAPGHMFGGNTVVSGGQFSQVFNGDHNQTHAFELLQRRVAASAFHNSAQRVDPPRCHPDTRVAILNSIYDWIVKSEDRDEWLLWLNGAAGAGKSAIFQSIAERCARTAIAIASFFFFRGDATRNSTSPLIATLAYQLTQVIPQTKNDILRIIEQNPLIFEQSLESQLQHLLIDPLLRLPEHLRRLFIVFIDGLDECGNRDHQSNLIKLFGTVSRDRNGPIMFLFASRREPQIEAAFKSRQISHLLRTIPLDNSDIEQTSEDIGHFLTDRFEEIKETHLRGHLLPSDWPPMSAIEEIVTTSSGQFIYASVVINYVSAPRGNPAHSLAVIRGIRLRDPSSQNPFAQLDALYQHIFSQAEALDEVLDILAYMLITKEASEYVLERAFFLEKGGLEVCFADLTAVIGFEKKKYVDRNDIRFLHASLPDFLRDKTRSEKYHIDIEEYTTKLLCMLLDRVSSATLLSKADGFDYITALVHYHLLAIQELLTSGAKVSDQLQHAFLTFCFEFNDDILDYFRGSDLAYTLGRAQDKVQILDYLKQLNFNDQGQAYHHVLDVFATFFAKSWDMHNKYEKAKIKKSPDLRARIHQIRRNMF